MTLELTIKGQFQVDNDLSQLVLATIKENAAVRSANFDTGTFDIATDIAQVHGDTTPDELADLFGRKMPATGMIYCACSKAEPDRAYDLVVTIACRMIDRGTPMLALIFGGDLPLLVHEGATTTILRRGHQDFWRTRRWILPHGYVETHAV